MPWGTSGAEGGYAPKWGSERMSFYVDDNGITEFQWISPCELKEIVAESSEMLSFSEISTRFEQMFFRCYTDEFAYGGKMSSDEEQLPKIDYNIKSFQLCLARMPEQDNFDGEIIAPVWVASTVDDFGENYDGEIIHNVNPGGSYVMTINAIDGSI